MVGVPLSVDVGNGWFDDPLKIAETVRGLVDVVDWAINVMTWGLLPVAARLAKLGVRRLSAGLAIHSGGVQRRRTCCQVLPGG